MTATETIRSPITLRLAVGSFMVVSKVYAFDPAERRASVRLKTEYGYLLETVSLDELEALDADRNLLDVESIVRRMAIEVFA